MLPASGLYGHIQNNNAKSIALFAGFLASLVLLWSVLYLAWIVTAPFLVMGNKALYAAAQARLYQVPASFHLMVLETLYLPLVAGIAWAVFAAIFHARLIRATTGSRAIARRDAPVLYRLTENLAITAGIPTPAIEIIESPALNAYASGLSPSDASVTVTRGLLERMNRRELLAVLAHEITHIRNYDTRLTVVSTVLQGMMAMVAEVVWTRITRHRIPLADIFLTRPDETNDADSAARQRGRFYAFLYWHMLLIAPVVADAFQMGAGRPLAMLGLASLIVLAVRSVIRRARGWDSSDENQLGYLPSLKWLLLGPFWLLMMFGGFLATLGYALSAWSTGAISRSREFMADAGAVELTKDADALITALARINGRDQIANIDSTAMAMMISAPRAGWLATHPPIEARIAALRQFAGGRVELAPGRDRRPGTAAGHAPPRKPGSISQVLARKAAPG